MDTLDMVIEGGERADPELSYGEALTAYLERLNAAEVERYAQNYPNSKVPSYVILGRGHKYDRVARVEAHETCGCAVAFVERETGMIWKPAGYKGPERNFPRGNVFHLPKRLPEAREDPVLHIADAWP